MSAGRGTQPPDSGRGNLLWRSAFACFAPGLWRMQWSCAEGQSPTLYPGGCHGGYGFTFIEEVLQRRVIRNLLPTGTDETSLSHTQ